MSNTATSLPTVDVKLVNDADLDEINELITAGVMKWPVADRVKRLTLPLYLYNADEVKNMLLIAARVEGKLVGIAALEDMDTRSLPKRCRTKDTAMLLHGLYVHPDFQHHGLGTLLCEKSAEVTRQRERCGMMVKAQAHAIDFFKRVGMEALEVRNISRDYPHRFWLPLG